MFADPQGSGFILLFIKYEIKNGKKKWTFCGFTAKNDKGDCRRPEPYVFANNKKKKKVSHKNGLVNGFGFFHFKK